MFHRNSSFCLCFSLFLPRRAIKRNFFKLLHSRVWRKCPFPARLSSVYQSLSRPPSRCSSISPDICSRSTSPHLGSNRCQPAPGRTSCRLPIAASVSLHLSRSVLLRSFIFFHCPHISFHSHLHCFIATKLPLSISISFVPLDLYRYHKIYKIL